MVFDKRSYFCITCRYSTGEKVPRNRIYGRFGLCIGVRTTLSMIRNTLGTSMCAIRRVASGRVVWEACEYVRFIARCIENGTL